MPGPIRLPEDAIQRLCCPHCKGGLILDSGRLVCKAGECGAEYPVVEGIPVLIDDDRSLFRRGDFVERRRTTYDLAEPAWKRIARARLPTLGKNIKAAGNVRRLIQLTTAQAAKPLVLIVGGRTLGEGMQALAADPRLLLVESDVAFGPRTNLIADGHDIPFLDGTFDAVVIQAVLEHVLDPERVVAEIHRVLKPAGLVYAETPFMQQVHGGRFDFTRFTALGHRRLFRRFEEIDSGAVCGPGMALAWSYQFFLLSFARRRWSRLAALGFARLTAFFWKYFDYILIDKPAALDAASGCFFLGRRSEGVVTDRELIQQYRGNAYA